MKQLYRAAHQRLLKRPSQGAVLEAVKRMVTDEFPEMARATSLPHARDIMRDEINERVLAKMRTLRGGEMPIRQGMTVYPETITAFYLLDMAANQSDIRRSWEEERRTHTALFLHHHPHITHAKDLLHAFLEHSQGPKVGYGLYRTLYPPI